MCLGTFQRGKQNPTPRVGDGQNLQYPQTSVVEGQELTGGESTTRGDVSRTPQPVGTSTPQTIQQASSRERTKGEETIILRQPMPEGDQAPSAQTEARGGSQGDPLIHYLRLPRRLHLQDPLGRPEPGIRPPPKCNIRLP